MFKGDKKQKKQTSGITLVALVVTIVVLLILAGITITMLFSDSGIKNKAREIFDFALALFEVKKKSYVF